MEGTTTRTRNRKTDADPAGGMCRALGCMETDAGGGLCEFHAAEMRAGLTVKLDTALPPDSPLRASKPDDRTRWLQDWVGAPMADPEAPATRHLAPGESGEQRNGPTTEQPIGQEQIMNTSDRPKCRAPGCEHPVKTCGLCNTCYGAYLRAMRGGVPAKNPRLAGIRAVMLPAGKGGRRPKTPSPEPAKTPTRPDPAPPAPSSDNAWVNAQRVGAIMAFADAMGIQNFARVNGDLLFIAASGPACMVTTGGVILPVSLEPTPST